MSIPDSPKVLTTRVSGNDGNATGRLGGASRSLDLIQARDDTAAEDVGGFGPDLGDDVAELASIGHVLLVGGLRQVDLLNQRFLDRAAGWLDGQKILELL